MVANLKAVGASVVRPTVLDVIQTRLAGITEDKFIFPQSSYVEGVQLGRLTSDQMKLWTLLQQVKMEVDEIVDEMNDIRQWMNSQFADSGNGMIDVIKVARKDGVSERIERHEVLDGKLKTPHRLYKTLKRLFWHEVRDSFDAWDKGKLVIDRNWNVYVPERHDDSPSIGEVLSAIFGRRGGGH